MKKIGLKTFSFTLILILFFIPLFNLSTFADEEDQDAFWNRMSYEKKLCNIGAKIIKANELDTKVGFVVIRNNKAPNAYLDPATNELSVQRSLFRYIDSDDELAAIIAHELAHAKYHHYIARTAKKSAAYVFIFAPLVAIDLVVTGFTGVPCPMFSRSGKLLTKNVIKNSNQVYETEADLVGVDYMVKAGYNPCAMESIMSKIAGDGLMIFRDHPLGSVRVSDIHNYIAAKYPDFLEEKIKKDQENIINVSNISENPSAQINTPVQVVETKTEEQKLPENNKFYLTSFNSEAKDFDYANNISFLPYLKNLRIEVLNSWYHKSFNKELICTLSLNVNNAGTLTSLTMLKSSGNEAFDMSCINAIKHAGTFKPFPADYAQKNAEIQFTFKEFTKTFNDPIVTVNLKTGKYHKSGCRIAKNCGSNCIRIPKSEAIKNGNVPCKICF